MMRNLLVLLLVQLVVGEGVLEPMDVFLAPSQEQVAEAEWPRLIAGAKPNLDIPSAQEIVQPENVGKTSVMVKYIVGGSEATLGQFPWQALLIIDSRYLCGGSLILAEWVLTAAHCAGSSYVVTLGLVTRSPQNNGAVSVTSTSSVRHPLYNSRTISNDVALVRLPSAVAFTANIAPVKLPPQADATKDFVGTVATVSGFGKTSDVDPTSNVLKFTQMSVIGYQECASVYGTSVVISSTLCTKQTGTSTCNGDSGGPLVYLDSSNAWTQIGVVSFGLASGCLDGPSGFARVTSFLGWMSQVVGSPVSETTAPPPTTTTLKPTRKNRG